VADSSGGKIAGNHRDICKMVGMELRRIGLLAQHPCMRRGNLAGRQFRQVAKLPHPELPDIIHCDLLRRYAHCKRRSNFWRRSRTLTKPKVLEQRKLVYR
jgi:hypothetical protein